MPKVKYNEDELIANWKTGRYTVRTLAKEYRLSIGKVHSIVSGIDKEIAALAEHQVEINQKLAEMSEQDVQMFKKEVNRRERALQFFEDVTFRNLSAVDKMLDDESTIVDRLTAQTIYQKGRDTWLGKEPASQTNIQQNNTTVNEVIECVEFIAVEPNAGKNTITG